MDTTERVRSPWGVVLYTVLLGVDLVALGAVLVVSWSLRTTELSIIARVLLLIGGLLLVASFTWVTVLTLRLQANARIPRAHGGRLTLTAPDSARRVIPIGMVGLATIAVGTVFVLPHGISEANVPMTSYRWALVVALLLTLVVLAVLLLAALRLVRIRFVADRSGLAWDHPFRPIRIEIAWGEVERIELRGRRLITQRLVVITRDGRERIAWAYDPSIAISTEAARALLAEIEAIRSEAVEA
jgi:hypothetical protein